MHLLRRFARDENGSAIVLLALFAIVIAGVAAVAIDGSMLFSTRREAQRAADAAALAGASAFTQFGGSVAVNEARTRALDYASRNAVAGAGSTGGDVDVRIVPESTKVAVTIRRTGVPTWFMRMLGRNTAPISALASGRAMASDVTRCVKPFAPADMWSDADDDLNHNRIQDGSEWWVYGDNPGDRYRVSVGNVGAVPAETGYGSVFRGSDLDAGRRLLLNSHANQSGGAAEYYTWDMPQDPGMPVTPGCSSGGGDGASEMRSNVCNCNRSNIRTGVSYSVNTGNMVGPIHQGVEDLIALDPNAYWDPAMQMVVGSNHSPWWTSPRIVTVPLYAPTSPPGSTIRFTKFMNVFVESQPSSQDPIAVRFLHVISGLKLVQ